MVMVCPVNSTSKYRVSVSEVTWGLKGGTSCGGTEFFLYLSGFSLLTKKHFVNDYMLLLFTFFS